MLQTKAKFCFTAGTNEEPDDWAEGGQRVPPSIVPPGNEPFATPRRFVQDEEPFQAAPGSMRKQESP